MYRSCIFCTRDLGSNETIEAFPVGRRLAFDPAKGRLWVVCPRCQRWNLSPLEERWEAIDACERAYRDTRLRAATENVGLARAGDGLELVRIGRPERPEMAAWRYGAIFARRRRKVMFAAAVGIGVNIPLLLTGAHAALLALVPGGMLVLQVPHWILAYRAQRKVLARIPEAGEIRIVRQKHERSAVLLSPDQNDLESWAFGVDSDTGLLRLHGDQARHVAGVVLARLNQTGGGLRVVHRAVQRLEQAGDSARLIAEVADAIPSAGIRFRYGERGTELVELPKDQRLALEMATHEESERRALEGELKALELAWEDAERIAAISDDLLLSQQVRAFLERHRR